MPLWKLKKTFDCDIHTSRSIPEPELIVEAMSEAAARRYAAEITDADIYITVNGEKQKTSLWLECALSTCTEFTDKGYKETGKKIVVRHNNAVSFREHDQQSA